MKPFSIFANAIAFASVTALIGCASYKTIEQETADREELKDRAVLFSSDHEGRKDGGTGFPYLRALKAPPKRVALVTFSVNVPVNKEDKGTFMRGTTLSKGGVVKVAGTMMKTSLETLKKTFKNAGMEVLEPKEFLTTDEKKQAYENFSVKIEGSASFLAGLTKFGNGGMGMDAAEGAAPGYHLFDDITTVYQFSSVSNSIGGDLCRDLGVDAVLLVTNEVGTNDKSTWLQNVRMYMYGPNPIRLPAEDIGSGMFKDNRTGHVYAAAMIKKGFKDTYIEPKEKEQRTSLDDEKYYAGYDRIIAALSERVVERVQTQTTAKE